MHNFTSKVVQEINGYSHNHQYIATQTVELIADSLVYPDEISFENVTYLAEHANNALLVHVAEKLAKEQWSLLMTPEILSPLVFRILQMPLDMQKRLFKGNNETSSDISRPSIYSDYDTCLHPESKIRLYSDKDNDKFLNKGDFGMARLIHKIHLKHESLLNRGEISASGEALTLYQDLNKYYLKYLSSEKNELSFKKYRNDAKERISTARLILDNHRGWKNLFANILLHIGLLVTTAGIGNITAFSYAYSKNNTLLMFRLTKTDASIKLDTLNEYLDKCPNEAFPDRAHWKPI